MRRIFVVFILTVALCLGLIPAGGGVFAAETQDTASDTGFVINKVDDNEVPVEGAVFDIYGKPEVSWEEIKKPDPEPCELDPPVEKIITGDTELIGGGVLPKFSFTLKAAYPSYPMPGGHEGDEMHATVNGEGPVEFGFITFTEAGTYEYTVSEDPHGEENYSVDENVYTITYVIEEVDGKLQGVRTFFKKGEVQEAIEKIVFENVYTAPVPRRLQASLLPRYGMMMKTETGSGLIKSPLVFARTAAIREGAKSFPRQMTGHTHGKVCLSRKTGRIFLIP